MNDLSETTVTGCILCTPDSTADRGERRCRACIERGDLVGDVVWSIVCETVEDARAGERIAFMLAGLGPAFLEGVARKLPGDRIEGRSLLFRISPSVVSLGVSLDVPHQLLSDESPVYYRNNDLAEVLVFAPSDEEREGIGAGLGPVSRIDSGTVVDRLDDWLSVFEETGAAGEYLDAALNGLRDAGAFIDLEMWVDFVRAISAQGYAEPVDVRIQEAAHALQVPRTGIEKLPKFKPDGKGPPDAQAFARAFDAARSEVGGYPFLITPKNEPVDVARVRDVIDGHEPEDAEVEAGLAAARALLDDRLHVRPGDWRESQEHFCRTFPWARLGRHIFEGRQKARKSSLGERTLGYIIGDYASEVTEHDRKLLESLKDKAPKEPSEAEQEFFAQWQDRLNRKEAGKLYKEWHKRLFNKEVLGHDLLSALSEGFEALVVTASDDLEGMTDPCILVRAEQHDKASYWSGLDRRVHALFCFEVRALMGALGDCVAWDLDRCFEAEYLEEQNTATARCVVLELYLVERAEVGSAAGSGKPSAKAPRVKATWRPAHRSRETPIGLALPEDIDTLAQAAREGRAITPRGAFAPKARTSRSGAGSTTLTDTNTISDAAGGQEGRMVDVAGTSADLLSEVRESIGAMQATGGLDAASARAVTGAVDAFSAAYSEALVALSDTPSKAFSAGLVAAQAEAFGHLCHVVRERCRSERAKAEIRPLIAGIGIVPSSSEDDTAIIAAWHPFRLAERGAKIADFGRFIDEVLTAGTVGIGDLGVAFEERRRLCTDWFFPEVALLGRASCIAVEDVGGYGLLVRADCVARNEEALEQSAPDAAKKFVEGVDEYLKVHPHEATNLSAAIYNAESPSLPREIARLMTKRIRQDKELRCDLVITHENQKAMRRLYEEQNTRLAAESLGESAKGFLSRLRVGVEPTASEAGEDGVHDIDLVFLHDAVNRYSQPAWDYETGGAETLGPDFDLRSAIQPRRRLGERDAPSTGVFLTVPHPPRPVAEYHDLLYEIAKDAVLPDGYHAVLTRILRFDDQQVETTVSRAHELGEWVVSYDQVSSRQVLERCGVRIIRDVSMPGTDARVIISAKRAGERLKKCLREELSQVLLIDAKRAWKLCDTVLEDTVEISGQKILSGARYINATREVIGLSVARAHMQASMPDGAQPVWISLDDYRGWFTTATGRIADILAVTIVDDGAGFMLLLQVGEAKFVGADGQESIGKEAMTQLRDTADRLQAIFVDNEDSVSRAAWCARLSELLVTRDGLSERIPDAERRARFLEAMARGNVSFKLSGEAVVCLHDDQSLERICLPDQDHPHLRRHVLSVPEIRRTLEAIEDGTVAHDPSIPSCEWVSGDAATRSVAGERSIPASVSGGAVGVNPSVDIAEKGGTGASATNKSASEPASPEAPSPGYERSEPTSGGCDEDTGSSAEETTRPRFVPEPLHRVLTDMRAREGGTVDAPETIEWAESICQSTQRALSQFGMRAEFDDPKYRLTPNGVLITFRGHSSLTTEKVEKRQGELLTTHGIDVADVRPGRGRISVFVRREERASVPLASAWLGAHWPDREPGQLASFLVGPREDNGSPLYLNLAEPFGGYDRHGPHTLIAGETGSGKGVLTQSLLLEIIAFNSPEAAELIVVDPKSGVDFGWIVDAPHLKRPIATEVSEAQALFPELVEEMDARYGLFSTRKVPNIEAYNRAVGPSHRMPRIFVVHDEMGAWMADEKEYRETVLGAVSNLGMKARAAGIHLILITQRADADAIPTRLRDNMGNRLCLRVSNGTGSRMALGHTGAEKLLGRGHLAATFTGQSPPSGQEHFVTQVPFAEMEDVERLAAAAISYWTEGSS